MEESSSSDTGNGNFVTVVSIGNETYEEKQETPVTEKEFVTVLRIGEKSEETADIIEEVLVYRLPGERLGFGLKFEGGTKATECIKRLFVQSCAPDSPASRVLSSWGNLTEGDEVLVIDSQPVNSMTRLDCVKCLKDSNVIIKLLVRHSKRNVNISDNDDAKIKVDEDLPQVISAEKKKTQPPPPPPVPPRKIPRKLLKSNQSVTSKIKIDEKNENSSNEDPLPPVRQKHVADANNNGKIKNQKNIANSPEIKRSRKYSDGSLGPPDAEIYTDLFSHESLHSLSESDDTASTISTVIDKNSNSLPSTPKSIQKHLDISNFPNDEDLFNMNSTSEKLEIISVDNELYQNEKTLQIEIDANQPDTTKIGSEIIAEYKTEDLHDTKNCFDNLKMDYVHDENMNIFSLPRLVDFVPKTVSDMDEIKIMNLFLESERSDHYHDFEVENNVKRESFDDNDIVFPKWSVSSPLATIGEVEEDGSTLDSLTDGSTTPVPPIVIVQNADDVAEKNVEITENSEENTVKRDEQIMEPLPSDPRQPPDGHEFPDFEERFSKTTNDSLLDKLRLNFSHHGVQPNTYRKSSFEINSDDYFALNKIKSMSKTDFTNTTKNRDGDCHAIDSHRNEGKTIPLLYTRSQSLCDISVDKKQNDHWQNMMEQRRKSLSKLKGLVIPDAISEVDYSTTINLPEIKSCTSIPVTTFNSLESSEASNDTSQPSSVDSSKFPLISPPWAENVNFPKYSPAFKRKDLQLYTTTTKSDSEKSNLKLSEYEKGKVSVQTEDLTVPIQSADSSPTRSESSYEYTSGRLKSQKRPRPLKSYSIESSLLGGYHKHKTIDDESDNDSAVSSSQSSFISRPTTSPSPTRSIELDNASSKLAHSECRLPEPRHLKPASVEAINRKNILASSKCRSGKDFKVGSPVINRKLVDSDDDSENKRSVEENIGLGDNEIKPEVNPVERRLSEQIPMKLVSSIQIPNRKKSVDILPAQPPVDTELKTKFESLAVTQKTQRPTFSRSVSKDSAPIFRNILRPIPVPATKREERVSRFASSKSLSVTDLRKNFEEIAKAVPLSVSSNEKISTSVKSRKPETTVPKIVCDKISHDTEEKPLQKEMDCSVKESSIKSCKVVLKPDVVGGSLGIAITGGVDEKKEITIQRIRYGSVAYQEGTLTKGDRLLSINGISTKELTHLEAVELLKAPVKLFTIEVAIREHARNENSVRRKSISLDSSSSSIPGGVCNTTLSSKKPNHEITLQKDGNGLGFSIEGGRDSPLGDVPLIVKKIFQGGVADKDGRLKVGDEILAINDISFTNLSRIQAWTMMKKLDVGTAKISIYR